MLNKVKMLSLCVLMTISQLQAVNEPIPQGLWGLYSQEKLMKHVEGLGNINWSFKYEDGKTVMHYAALRDCADLIKYFADSGVAVDESDHKGYTPLQYAVSKGNIDAIAMLIKHEAKRDVRTRRGTTLVELAANNDKDSTRDFLLHLEELLRNGFRLDAALEDVFSHVKSVTDIIICEQLGIASIKTRKYFVQ